MIWLIAFLALPLFGLFVWRVPLVRRLDLGARLAIALAAGCVAVAAIMFAFTLVNVPYKRTTLLIAVAAMALLGTKRPSSGALRHLLPASRGEGSATGRMLPNLLLVAFLLLTLYGLVTARETCGDLLYFWGPKAVRFAYAEKLDADFLALPHFRLMHPDYPPLLPLVYTWASVIARGFSYWGALLSMALLILASALAFRGLARDALGSERASAYAMLLAAILSFTFAQSMVAGAAEPMLLFFEVVAVAALTFRDDTRDGAIIAAIALAGAAWTKVEGAAFVAIVLVAYAVTRRRVVRALAAAIPSVLLLGAWLLFAKRNTLIDQYGRAGEPMHFEALGTIVKTMAQVGSYDALWIPWIAAAGPLSLGRNRRRAALPLLVVGGLIASSIYFYLHSTAQVWWIRTSADRVLISPLAVLLVASAAASE